MKEQNIMIWTDCQQEAMHLLIIIFGRRERKICFEARKGGGSRNISSPRQGRAAGISLLTNSERVWRGGDFFFLSLMYEILWGFKQNDFQELFRDEGTDWWVSRILGFFNGGKL